MGIPREVAGYPGGARKARKIKHRRLAGRVLRSTTMSSLAVAGFDPVPLLLVIDDEAPIHRAFERLFKHGFRVMGAQDGDMGLDLARANDPDLILLDINMPHIDGRDVLGRLRADPRLKNIPVAIITGRSDHLTRLQLLEAGAEDVFEKPFDPVLLERRLHWMLEKARRVNAH